MLVREALPWILLATLIFVIIYMLFIRSVEEDGWLYRYVWQPIRPFFKGKKAPVSESREAAEASDPTEEQELLHEQEERMGGQ